MLKITKTTVIALQRIAIATLNQYRYSESVPVAYRGKLRLELRAYRYLYCRPTTAEDI